MKNSIVMFPAKKLVGTGTKMSLHNNQTAKLWQILMPKLKNLQTGELLSADKFSLQIYPPHYFNTFNPACYFEKWALVELSDDANLPEGLQWFNLPGGLYAKFSYKGPAGNPAPFAYILNEWLPTSGYNLDNRPHFEILGALYNNISTLSQEVIYIPIKPNLS